MRKLCVTPFVLSIDRRKRIIIACLVGAVLLLIFVVHPLARSVASAAARNRGWVLQPDSVRFGWRGFWLLGVRVQSAAIPELQGRLGAVLVPWSGIIGSKQLVVSGGAVRLPANLGSIQQRLGQGANGRIQTKASRWRAQFSGLTLWWRSTGDDIRFAAWGLAGDATNDACDFSADRIEAEARHTSGVAIQLKASLQRSKSDWMLQTAELARMNIQVNHLPGPGLEPGGRLPVGTVAVSEAGVPNGNAAADMATLERGKGGGKKATQDLSRAASTATQDVIERAIRGLSRLQTHTNQWRHAIEPHLAPTAIGSLRELNLRWQYQQQKLEIGPLHAQLRHDAQTTECVLEQKADANAGRRYLMLRVPKQPSKLELEADVGSVPLQALGVKEDDLGLRGVADTRLAMALKVSIDEIGATAEWQARGELIDLNLVQPWLAPRPVDGIQTTFSGKGDLRWKPEFSLHVQDLAWGFGNARLEVTAHLQRKSEETIASIDVQVPLAACGDLVEAIPHGLAPLASLVSLDGTLSLEAGVRFDTARPNAAEVRWNLANGCRVKSASPAVSPDRFRSPFILEVPDEHQVFVQRAFGPGTPNWVAFADMSSHLASAVLVCEDGGFFRHGGFDAQAIRNSIRENLVQGRFARGASTVSMQLAKNLYLRREKTFSRKLQEAVLTVLLEQSFSKNELMELYLNVVELGPGIYGVGEASRAYFNTTPAMLSPLQAYYLVSLLPKPKASHFGKDGHLHPGWLKLLRHLMTIANKRHYLSDDELKAALQDDLRLGVAETGAVATEVSLAAPDQEALADPYDANEQ